MNYCRTLRIAFLAFQLVLPALCIAWLYGPLSGEAGDVWSYRHGGKSVYVPISTIEGVRVNDVCAERPERCKALLAYRAPSQMNELRSAVQGNFAGAYCELLRGTQLFLGRAGAQPDTLFCVFQDLTMIDGTSLYGEHARKASKVRR